MRQNNLSMTTFGDYLMKKSLLALAVLGAVAGVAQAQSAVTIYGIIDAAVVRESGSPIGAAPVTKLSGGSSAGSRVGFRGTEDLGNGLQGIFTLENGFNADDGTFGQGGRFFGRQAFVGLKGGFGTVSFGRQQNPMRTTLLDFDPNALAYQGPSSDLIPTYGQRTDNSFKYASPNIGGFIGELFYGIGEIAGESKAGRTYGGSVGYTNGPIGIKLVHQGQRLGTPGATGALSAANPGALFRTSGIFASYNLGIAKLSLGYTDNDGAAAGTGALPAGIQTAESRDVLVGLNVPFGPNTVKALYIRKIDGIAENDADLISLSYDYALSKRTAFYTSFGRIYNDNLAAYTIGNGSGAGTGEKGFAVGVRHTF